MHQAKTAGQGLQPRPKRLFSGVGKYFGRGCKPRPADHGLIKTMSYDLSLMHMGGCGSYATNMPSLQDFSNTTNMPPLQGLISLPPVNLALRKA
ncbi:Uncharacterized protein dnm_038900 [Desulfonema magnum]|uniref:Uncharacterized protein n=1 Tax=Desulfonema magnum TaxID=45655 RepID=A0A975GNJ9_9BACT|nr:Uncharacterized protein dnm_038900 [Desulfonema magnum]